MKKTIWISIFSAICAIISLAFYVMHFYENGLSDDPQHWALFGNYIGGVLGAVFGLISIFVVCMTFRDQVEYQRIQRLDSNFFNLLSIQQKIIYSIKGYILKDGSCTDDYHNYDYIKILANVIQNTEISESNNIIEYQNALLECYSKTESNNNQLGYYFRHLYHIIKYVDESEVDKTVKKKYVDLIQAQMNDSELYLCLINSYSEYGKGKFLPLLAKYDFFENIKDHGAQFDALKKSLYPKTDFKY